ncbi:MAG: hypothetical protein VXY93_22410, partial [Pseudomonadota bacterium]|nr:hypothetical protein [Pseudomonadota bacterium]
ETRQALADVVRTHYRKNRGATAMQAEMDATDPTPPDFRRKQMAAVSHAHARRDGQGTKGSWATHIGHAPASAAARVPLTALTPFLPPPPRWRSRRALAARSTTMCPGVPPPASRGGAPAAFERRGGSAFAAAAAPVRGGFPAGQRGW